MKVDCLEAYRYECALFQITPRSYNDTSRKEVDYKGYSRQPVTMVKVSENLIENMNEARFGIVQSNSYDVETQMITGFGLYENDICVIAGPLLKAVKIRTGDLIVFGRGEIKVDDPKWPIYKIF